MNTTTKIRRGSVAAAIAVLGATTLAGCGARTTVVPAASPPTTGTTTVVVTQPAGTQRVINYSTGRYELYGDGVSTPYYWVWIPAGSTLPAPPPPPGVPR
jgi:hypothetical protein